MASFKQSASFRLRHGVMALCATGAAALAAAPAQAQVPGLSVYIGAGVGQSNADIDAPDFDAKDMAWKVLGGVRIASVLGAELAYVDFGKVGDDVSSFKYKGLAAHGLFYVPLPLPLLDIYGKAGMARVDVESNEDTKFTYGAGLQLKFGSLAIRGEYERFKVEDADPSLLSISFTKSFL